MNRMIEPPFKLTPEEILCSAATTLCLLRLAKMGTPEQSLDEMCLTPQYGFTASASWEPCGPRFVRITDIKGGTIDWQTVPFCECTNYQGYELASGDILVARSGSIGKSFIVTNVTDTAVFASYMIRLRTKPSYFSSYVYWCLQSQQFWLQIMEAHRGSAMKNINGKMLSSLKFPSPSKPIQKSIVTFLECFRKRLEGVNQTLPELPPSLADLGQVVIGIEELAAKIEEARGLRGEAVEEAEALSKSKLAAIVDTLIKQNGSCQLSNLILQANYGTSTKCLYERTKGSIPVLRIPNVASEQINLDDMKYGIINNTELQRVLVAEGDVLVVRTNGSANLVGRCAVVPILPESTAFASYMIRLRCDNRVVASDYIQLMLKHLRTNGQLIDFARTTAGQYNVSLGRLRAAKIPVPPLPEQRRIVAYLDDLQARVDTLKQLQAETSVELDALLPSILDRAFRGEL